MYRRWEIVKTFIQFIRDRTNPSYPLASRAVGAADGLICCYPCSPDA